MNAYHFAVTPVPKPRQTRSDKWKKRESVLRYRAFADELRLGAQMLRFKFPASGASILFVMPMPRSWSKTQRMEMDGQPHRATPDLDNLLKSLFDALLPLGDHWVWALSSVRKVWGESGKIVIEI